MKIAIACDHAGFPIKETVLEVIKAMGHETVDYGTYSTDSVDYPDFVKKAGQALQERHADRAIIICGSGVGACIAANKMQGVYAAICHDTYSARQGVEHDHMNALCLGGRIVGPEVVKELVKAYLEGVPSQDERHLRRLKKTRAIEEGE
jgi:ribose 5-phosphate isomerase B